MGGSLRDALPVICYCRHQQAHQASPFCPLNHIRCFLSSALEFTTPVTLCNWRFPWVSPQIFISINTLPVYASSVPGLSQSHRGRPRSSHDAALCQNGKCIEALISIWTRFLCEMSRDLQPSAISVTFCPAPLSHRTGH